MECLHAQRKGKTRGTARFLWRVTLEGALGRGVGGNIVGGGPDDVLLSPIGSQTQSGSVNVTTGVMRFNLKLMR